MPQPALVPELLCTNIDASHAFYVETLGFTVKYERPEDKFLYLALGDAELMLEQAPMSLDDSDFWWTGAPEHPLGRGINFEIGVPDAQLLHNRVVTAGHALFRPMEEKWYRAESVELGCRQFLIQDPDGYLLRFSQDLGKRHVQPPLHSE